MNPNSIRKLHAYSKNPELIKEPTMPELANLVIVVLGAVSQIEKAIKEGRLDGKTPEADKDYISAQTAKTMIRSELDNMLAQADSVLSQTATEMDKRVQQALQNIRNGNDGIVTDAEIERAAQMALSLIEVPDFDALVTKALTENANATRDGLESIKEEEDKLKIEAIGHLKETLEELKSQANKGSQAGGMSRNAVLELIAQNGGGVSDGDKGDITVSGNGAVWSIDDDTIGQDELATTGTPDGSKFLRDDFVWTAIPGGGDALVANPLSQFAATTSAQLRGVMSDEVGTGPIVFSQTKAEFNTAVTDGNFMYVGDAPTAHTHPLSEISDVTASATEVNVLDGIPATLTATELGYVDGVTSSIQTQLNAKEATANKATNFSTVNDTLYPTVEAVTEYVASAVVGLLDYRGTYDASTNLYPATGGSGLAGAVLKGDFYIVSVAGTLGGTAVTPGDLVIALVDTPAQTSSNWDIVSGELGYTPENIANKVTSISGASTDTQYPSAKLTYDQLALKLTISNIDDTPVNGETAVPISSNWAFDHAALAASDTVVGHVELATTAETNTGTDATRAVTPDALAGSNFGIRYVQCALNGTTALTTSEKVYFRIPVGLNGMNLVSVTGSVGTGAAGSSSSGTPTFTVKNVTDGNQMLSTSLTIDANEYTSATAAAAVAINASFDDVVTDDLIEVAVTTAGTGVTYAVVTLGFQIP